MTRVSIMSQLQPFYLVCDESGSMSTVVDGVNRSLARLLAEIGDGPAAERVRFCLIGFSDDAEVLLPLADLRLVAAMPELGAKGQTRYGRAFDRLRVTIEDDLRALARAGHEVLRPAVFFLSDGLPTDDDWLTPYAALLDRTAPGILAFGFGQADLDTISQVATVRAFMADGSMEADEALREFAGAVLRMIAGSATGALVSLDEVPGFAAVAGPQSSRNRPVTPTSE
jgi:uncharacterized protein YegL